MDFFCFIYFINTARNRNKIAHGQNDEKLTKEIEEIFSYFSAFCDKESLADYAKKLKKAKDNYENAIADDDKYKLESAEYEMQQAFPMMFRSMIDLEEDDVIEALDFFGIKA